MVSPWSLGEMSEIRLPEEAQSGQDSAGGLCGLGEACLIVRATLEGTAHYLLQWDTCVFLTNQEERNGSQSIF